MLKCNELSYKNPTGLENYKVGLTSYLVIGARYARMVNVSYSAEGLVCVFQVPTLVLPDVFS